MAVRYNETGEGLQGYRWVSLSEVKLGEIAYWKGRDMLVVGIETVTHVFTRTEPIVHVIDLATAQPDRFQCQSPTEHILVKDVLY